MATFVLVAGAWHGGWAWKRTTPLLRNAGHDVYAATLTGVGERVHLAAAATGVEVHVQDVVNLIIFEDLTDVVLVGHSYAGVVTGAVVHRVPERISKLVLIDALAPEDGRSVLDIYRDHGLDDYVAVWLEAVETQGDGWLLPAPSPDSPHLRVTDEADIRWMEERLTAQPMATFTTPVHLGSAEAAAIPRTFVPCLPHPPGGLIPIVTKQMREDPSWSYRELVASHNPMLTDPEQFAQLLIDIAEDVPAGSESFQPSRT